eukprot:m.281670 g.281670  ORF g.281670 m.281670 type:complete len:124 (-) comp15753_c0_seq12:1822-2193(-)
MSTIDSCFAAKAPPLPTPSQRHSLNTIGLMLNITAGISILACTWVLFVILVHRLHRKQIYSVLVQICAANIGYCIFWLLPRHTNSTLVPDFYGGTGSCEKGIVATSYHRRTSCILGTIVDLIA